MLLVREDGEPIGLVTKDEIAKLFPDKEDGEPIHRGLVNRSGLYLPNMQ